VAAAGSTGPREAVDAVVAALEVLRERSADYRQRRWAPGRLEPVADGPADTVQVWLDLDLDLDLALARSGRSG